MSLTPEQAAEQAAEQQQEVMPPPSGSPYPPPQGSSPYPPPQGQQYTPQQQIVPGQIVWMQPPQMQAPPNCPPGLEYLLQVDKLLVKQQIEFFEAFTGFETANKYKVMCIFYY